LEKLDFRESLLVYNSLHKETDELYHSLARRCGFSDCALWILYIVRESGEARTQRDICGTLFMSKQTVNSALKNLEKSGYIELAPCGGDKRNKRILLTDAGRRFAESSVDRIMAMEQRAFAHFSEEERGAFLLLFRKYAERLRQEAEALFD
jgi:Transcriptional regulators